LPSKPRLLFTFTKDDESIHYTIVAHKNPNVMLRLQSVRNSVVNVMDKVTDLFSVSSFVVHKNLQSFGLYYNVSRSQHLSRK